MKRLEKLTLGIPEFHTEVFRKTFEEANVSFSSVRALVLGPHLDWVIALCPNIESIATHDWRWLCSDGDCAHRHSWDLIVSARRAKTLLHFEMRAWWSLERLEAVYRHMSEIQSLAMPGGCNYEGIEILLPVLGRFSQQLTSLSLAEVGSLGVGYNSPGCGNPFLGRRDQTFWRQEQSKARVVRKRVAIMVYTKLPGLKELWIGGHKET